MQQVNLFLAEFAPTPQRLGLRTLLQLLLALLLLLMLIGSFLFQQLHQQREQSSNARAALDGVIATISQSKGNEQARQNVAEQLQQLRRQLTDRQALLADLQQREQQQTRGFAPLLQTLAAQHDSRLWLTRITLKADYLQLTGETLNAAAVPHWLGKLQAEPPVQGLRFTGMELHQLADKPGVLAFSLNPDSLPESAPATGGDRDAAVQR